MDKLDCDLGMDADITRRDFLDGVAVTVGGAAAASAIGSAVTSPAVAAAASSAAAAGANYPPMRQGMRGFNPEAMEAGHSVRDGKAYDAGADTGEVYDLVVVGSGMAGLSAAYFYRKQIPNSKVLVLEGCDDFGGHARRVEFNVDGHQRIINGGTAGIWFPNTFGTEAKTLLQDLGIDGPRYYKYTEVDKNPVNDLGLKPAMFFGKDAGYGSDKLVPNLPSMQGPTPATDEEWRAFFAKTSFSDGAKAGLLKLYTDKTDYMPGVAAAEKVRQLKKMSYIDYLLKVANIHPDAVAYIQYMGGLGSNNQAAGPDTFSAWYAWRRKNPGFIGLGLPEASQPSNLTTEAGQHIFFPDGNGGVSRLLVRWLVPDALPGKTMEDSIAEHVKYEMLDRPSNNVRIRLSSTAIRVKHLGDPLSAKEVEVTYIRDGRPQRVRAGAVVMACFNAIVPYLVPELPEAQKAALHMAVRKPLVSTAVALRNWKAFEKLGVSSIQCPGMFYSSISLNIRSEWGGAYKNPANPNEPIIASLQLSANTLEKGGSGLPPREQWKAARAELQAIPFEVLERNVRSQLDRVLGPGGFSSRRDIAGITVSRWGHAYATGSNELYDPDWSHRTDAPWVVGRQRFGRITISNSDAAAVSLTQAAWMQSHRAVNEILTNIVRPVYDFHFSERDTAGEPGDYPNNF